jgi:hypothetical protein
MLVSRLAYSSTMKMEATSSTETLTFKELHAVVPEDSALQIQMYYSLFTVHLTPRSTVQIGFEEEDD